MPSTSQSARDSLAELVAGHPEFGERSRAYLFSSLHDLAVTEYPISPKPGVVHGGGLDLLEGNRLLVVDAAGSIRLIEIDGEALRVLPGRWETPFDVEAYRAAVDDPSQWFRVVGTVVDTATDGLPKLYVAYNHWDADKRCVSLKLAEAEIDVSAFGESMLHWIVRYTSEPCLERNVSNRTGGRIARLDDQTLLLTVGDHLARETSTDYDYLDGSSYGRIVALDTATWHAREYSSGHRNPQGLLVTTDGTVWATEHGPQGGDELNRIVDGADYGWPDTTYGTAYGTKGWPRNDTPGDHAEGERPVYAWVPSPAVSNLIEVDGSAFPSWRGDLLVGSLRGLGAGRSLYRVKMAGDRVVLVERIRTGRPVRDLVELGDGRLALWDGISTIQLVAPASNAFSACSGCHALHADRFQRHGIGPDLMGIVGAKVARHHDYEYSNALRAFGGKWTRERLDSYIEDPAAVVPGTTMEFAGIADPDEREAIIDYLENIRFRRAN